MNYFLTFLTGNFIALFDVRVTFLIPIVFFSFGIAFGDAVELTLFQVLLFGLLRSVWNYTYRDIRWKVVVKLGSVSALGSALGGWLSPGLPDMWRISFLLFVFLLFFAVGIRLLQRKVLKSVLQKRPLKYGFLFLFGILSSLIGTGGLFLIPMLAYWVGASESVKSFKETYPIAALNSFAALLFLHSNLDDLGIFVGVFGSLTAIGFGLGIFLKTKIPLKVLSGLYWSLMLVSGLYLFEQVFGKYPWNYLI